MTGSAAGRVVRFADVDLVDVVAHDGAGALATARVLERPPGEFVTFLDLTVIPPGASVGTHAHGSDDEEIYVVIDGTGTVELDGQVTEVGAGDVIINPPGGTHGLVATGQVPLRMVVVDVARVRPPATS
jgi:mannose-6-phosphate isomerase-like protein (cupin superfamily)